MSISSALNPFCKVQTHENIPIHYFCLDQFCHQKSLFCNICAKIDHRKHKIGRIDRLVEPLALLNINCFHEDSQEIYEKLKGKIDEFYEIMGSLQNLFDRTIKEIQKSTFFQIHCILETFSHSKIQEVQQLFLSQEPNQIDVRTAIEMINFLQFQGVEDCNTVKNVCEITLQKMTKNIQKTSSKIERIFQRLTKSIQDCDFISELKKYKIGLESDGKKILEEIERERFEKEHQNSQTQVPQCPVSQIKKEQVEKESRNSFSLQNTLKSKKANEKLTLFNKFNAFFQEDQQVDIPNQKQKIKKDRNLILVKKQY